MTKFKKAFNITSDRYIFDYNDVRVFLTLVNVVLVIIFGLSVAWVGLSIAIFGTIRDLVIEERKINSTLQHLLMIVLNSYFVYLSFTV